MNQTDIERRVAELAKRDAHLTATTGIRIGESRLDAERGQVYRIEGFTDDSNEHHARMHFVLNGQGCARFTPVAMVKDWPVVESAP